MTIELWDMDMPYDLQLDCNAEGKDFIRIISNPDDKDHNEINDICLNYNNVMELIESLKFMAKFIKPKNN